MPSSPFCLSCSNRLCVSAASCPPRERCLCFEGITPLDPLKGPLCGPSDEKALRGVARLGDRREISMGLVSAFFRSSCPLASYCFCCSCVCYLSGTSRLELFGCFTRTSSSSSLLPRVTKSPLPKSEGMR